MDEPFELMTFDDLDALTRGETMARLDRGHRNAIEARRQVIEFQALRAMQQVNSFTVTGNDNVCGLQAVAEIPRSIQAEWRARFVMEAERANVSGVTGYECWRDDGREGFLTRFKKLNPELFYKETRITNSIIRPATKWGDARKEAQAA